MILIAASHSKAGALAVEGLEAEYEGTEYVEFTLVNAGDTQAFVAIAVERLVEGSWREVTYSISVSDPTKGTRLAHLPPRGRKVQIWDSVQLPIQPGTYRFLFELRDPEKREPIAVEHSRAFEVGESAAK